MEKTFSNIVDTALPKDGLNQIMLRCRFLFVWLLLVLLDSSLKSVYPLSLRAFSCWYLDELKTSSFEEFLRKPSLILFGNRLIIFGGWFEDLLMYDNKSLDFLYGLYVPLFKLNVMSKRSTNYKVGFYVDSEASIFKYCDNIFVHSIYLLTIYIWQYEQSVIAI